MSGGVLVAGIGNIFQSDDAFGVEVANRLAERALPAGVRVEDFGIRGVHLAYELLEGLRRPGPRRRPPHGRAPGTLAVMEPELDGTRRRAAATAPVVDAHTMNPDVVLATLGRLGGPSERSSSRLPTRRPRGRHGAVPAGGGGRRRRGGAVPPLVSEISNPPERGFPMIRRLFASLVLAAVAALVFKSIPGHHPVSQDEGDVDIGQAPARSVACPLWAALPHPHRPERSYVWIDARSNVHPHPLHHRWAGRVRRGPVLPRWKRGRGGAGSGHPFPHRRPSQLGQPHGGPGAPAAHRFAGATRRSRERWTRSPRPKRAGSYLVGGDIAFRGVSRHHEDVMSIENVDEQTIRLAGKSTFDIREFGHGATSHPAVEGPARGGDPGRDLRHPRATGVMPPCA